MFSNLVHVSPQLWETFSQPGVRLATSDYSDEPTQHAAVTQRPTHARTTTNIAGAIRRAIPLRVGIIDVADGQRVSQARMALEAMGATEIGLDRLRQVGRGVRGQVPGLEELCGSCANGNLAVAPIGTVWPCVFTRWLPVGNLGEASLAEIVASSRASTVVGELQRSFGTSGALYTGYVRPAVWSSV